MRDRKVLEAYTLGKLKDLISSAEIEGWIKEEEPYVGHTYDGKMVLRVTMYKEVAE